MATFYIEEYANLAHDFAGNPIAAPDEVLARQKITITGTSAASSAFNASTRFIHISTDTICQWLVGASPTASVTSSFLPASDSRFLGGRLAGNKIAVIDQQ